MPLSRCKSQLPVPPPSPIPTAKGKRCSANEILSHYLDNTIQPPELNLPESYLPEMSRPLIPAEIDYRLLPFGGRAWVDMIVRSAKEFGAFRISGHGITSQQLGIVAKEAERVLQESGTKSRGNVVERNGSREMIPCVHSQKGTLEFTAPKCLRPETHRNFWIHMGNVAGRLDGIVQQVTLALQEHKSEEFKERIQETESVICLCKYPHGNATERDEGVSDDENDRLCDHALRFYLPMEHCIFYVQSERGPLSFDAGPETIVVIIGKQLEEWSQGEFKCVPAEMIFTPSFQSSGLASFSIELKCFSPNLNHSLNESHDHDHNHDHKIIALTDQILIVFCLAFLYKLLLFIFP